MSSEPQPGSIRQQIAGRWQIPLLLVALALLGLGLWRLRPSTPPVTFAELLQRAADLERAELYPEASRYIESLLATPNLQPEQARQLHGMLARVIYAYELGNVVHGESNAQRIISNSEQSLAEGESPDAATWLMRGRAWEWQKASHRAIECYKAALAGQVPEPWDVRKRILDIQAQSEQLDPDGLLAEYEALVGGQGTPDSLRAWAAECQVSLLAEQGKYTEAEEFLTRHAGLLNRESIQKDYQYLQALAAFHLGRMDDAEQLCRTLRDQLVPGYALYASTGWLLGKIMQANEAPQPALSFFDDVVSKSPPSVHRILSILGQAETLADLQRYPESLRAFEVVARLAGEDPYGSQIDLQVVRQSTTQCYEKLHLAGRHDEALEFLRLATRLAPPTDERIQIVYIERLADLTRSIGEKASAQARPDGGAPADVEQGQRARKYLAEAAEHYLHLAKLNVHDDPASVLATWDAAEVLDKAGEQQRVVSVLEAFVRERPNHLRVSEAWMRIGAAQQALGAFDAAIAAYQHNLIEFPRTIWAIQCLVPLARCFIDHGQPDKAELTLLRILDRPAGDELALIEPQAQEYRDALFLLGDLYSERGDYEKAISRLEEAIQRYPEDPRTDRIIFALAEACRHSAVQIRKDLEDPQQAGHKDELRMVHQRRLKRAEEMYGQLIDRLKGRPPESQGELDSLYLKLSHFYRADVVYDRCHVLDLADAQPYLEALQHYDQAAWMYQQDPITMSAYVQMINCHLRLGNVFEARQTLQRARWALRNIPEEQFERFLPQENREFWEDYLSWLGRMPMLSAGEGDAAG